MIKKILEKFGYITIAEHKNISQFLFTENAELKNENRLLQAEVISYRDAEKNEKPLIDFSLGDPEPQDTEARKLYVAQTSAFFKDILEPKLKFMLSNLHNMLEERDSDRDFDLVLKGVAYAFRDLIKWGNAMINEQVANQTNVSEGDIQSLKEKLNNT